MMKSLLRVFLAAIWLAGAWVGLLLVGVPGQDTPASRGNEIVLETEFIRYVLGVDGKNLSFFDKRAGRERLAARGRAFMLLKKGAVMHEPASCAAAGGAISVKFPRAGITAVVKATPGKHYLVFEVESLSDPDVDQLFLLNLPVTSGQHVSGMSGVAADADFAAAVRTLNLKTLGHAGGSPPVLSATAERKPGLVGAKVALVGCPAAEIRPVLQEVIREQGLPQSPLGGPWALDAPENRGSYVFANVSEKNVDDWIALARKAGLQQIHFHGWERSLGHYQPRKEVFPRGLAGLKATVAKIHAAGLRAGMHVLTGCISPGDPWVTPVPDKRLAIDASFTLAAPLNNLATTVLTAECPQQFDTIWAYGSRGNVVRIGDELIQFTGVSRTPPFGFTGCRRGAFGTRAAAHARGATVAHLFVRYTSFQPDENSTLVDDLAAAIGNVFNTCEFDMIYMDGAEGMAGGWYGEARMRAAIFRSLKRRTLVEASSWDYLSWPFHSRIGAYDHPNWGLKRFIDVHCRDNERARKTYLLPAELGWWAILGASREHGCERRDEIEYLCCKALAHDSPLSFQGVQVSGRPWCARQDEYLELIGQYERLRLAGYFPEAIRERLRQEKTDFRLVPAGSESWQFVPTDYADHKVTGLGNSSQAWTVVNRYGAQPVKLRIEALYSLQPFDSAAGLVFADCTGSCPFTAGNAASNIKHRIAAAPKQAKVGKASACYEAFNGSDSRRGAWALASKKFTPVFNLGERGGLGVWIHGDGKGELLNLQLTNPTQFWSTCDEHYVKVDFTGWRYFELLFRERDAEQYGDYVWPYGDLYSVYRSPLIYGHVNALNLYFNDLPPRDRAVCYISTVKALPTVKVVLKNPAISVGGRRILFPVALESGCSIEFESPADCRLYDERGALLQRLQPQGDVPTLAAGANALRFTCEGPTGFSTRAKITVINSGVPFPGQPK